MKIKPLKWWLLCLLALFLACWFSATPVPAQASPTDQAIFKIGGDLVVPENQTVTDAFAIGGDLTLQDGVVVEGDAFAIGGSVQLGENVQVAGDSFAIGGKVIRDDSAAIGGSEFTVMERFSGLFDRFGVLGTLYLTNIVFWLVGFLLAAFVGLWLLLLLPVRIDAIASTINSRPFNSLLYGFGGLLAISITTALLAGSALGAIAIPLINLVALFTSFFGGTAICVWLGRKLRSRTSAVKYFQHFSVGLLLLFFVSLIPFIGGLLISVCGLFGFGGALLSRFGNAEGSEAMDKKTSSGESSRESNPSLSPASASSDRFEHQTE